MAAKVGIVSKGTGGEGAVGEGAGVFEAGVAVSAAVVASVFDTGGESNVGAAVFVGWSRVVGGVSCPLPQPAMSIRVISAIRSWVSCREVAPRV